MTFIYDISDTTDTSSKMRLDLSDNLVEPGGILPEGRNFEDEELDHWYSDESDDYWNAIGRAFDAAAVAWAKYPEVYHMGPELQKVLASKFYAMKAQEARTKRLVPTTHDVTKGEIAMDLT
jgi:hypothetical protein